MLKIKKEKLIIVVLIIIGFSLRAYRLDYPRAYVFDEVYHAYTAKQYLQGNKEAWSPWGKTTEEKVAFEWLHPPVAKEMMAISMYLLKSTEPWAWRLPGVILGTLSIWLVYLLAQSLFKNPMISLTSALIFSIDGLVFVQSRTGMNDAYLVAFILISLLFYTQRKFLLSAIFLGIAIATKWSGIFLLIIYLVFLFTEGQNNLQQKVKKIISFLLIPSMVYLLSYIPYFFQGYKLQDFIELHRQTWIYQTHLKATHDYGSPWWSWPLNLCPIWYYVEYFNNGFVANIFASGNFLVFWSGSAALILTGWEWIRTRSKALGLILLGFVVFWLPWLISPRIMFLYHFSPSVPFLSLALGFQLNKFYRKKSDRILFWVMLTFFIAAFLLFYPILTGIPLPRNLMLFFFRTNLTKNPF